MRVARNYGAGVAGSEGEKRLEKIREQRLQPLDFFAQPETCVERDLLVTAAAGMDFVGEAGDLFLQLADDQGMDVFVGSSFEKPGLHGFFEDFVEGFHQGAALIGGEDADLLESAGECLRAADVGGQRSEEHTSELQSPCNLVCRLLLEKKKKNTKDV